MKKLKYRLLKGTIYTLSLLPFWFLYGMADFFFLLLYYIIRYRRKIVRKNLTASFPEMTPKEVKRVERRFYRWLCDYAVETTKLLSMNNEKLLRHLEFRGGEQMEECYAQGRNCAGIMGHFCNWEWVSAIGLAFPHYPQVVKALVYHPLYNEAFDKLFIDIRTAHGGVCVPKRDILRHIVTLKREEKQYFFGYVSDQSPKWENMHLWLDFLHHDTPVFTGAERIMQKMNEAVFYIDMERPRRGKYICTLRLITVNAAQEEEFAITRRFFKMLEESIHRQPECYLWTHNRWKRGREEFERKYNIIDGRIIRKEEYK